jgi:cell division protein ZapE
VDAGNDYRRRTLEVARLYLTPLTPEIDTEMEGIFNQLAETADEDPALNIEHRVLQAKRRAGGVVWFDFQTLCGGPRSQNDYLELASRFHTVMLSNVPLMPVRLASEARRFTWLIDVLYDRKCKLVISAEVPPEQLYTEGPMSHEFPRTVSRLNEMRSKEYLSEERRVVDTSIT